MALDVSVYSLVAVARAAAPLMEDGGSIMTMTYYASEKVVPRYNVMAVAKAGLECTVRYLAYELGKKKIRVNAISAGPIKTLAARGIAGFSDMLKGHAERAPLGRNVEVKRSATPEYSSPRTPAAASPAKSSTSTADITSWDSRFFTKYGNGGTHFSRSVREVGTTNRWQCRC